MSDTLRYKLEVEVSENIDVEEFEEFLQALLLDLYEQGSVESITVTKDGYIDSKGGDVDRLLNTLEGLDSEYIKRAIDVVKKMETIDTDDDK